LDSGLFYWLEGVGLYPSYHGKITKNQKNYRKERPMGKRLILSFFLSFLFIVCLSCSSNLPDNGVTILRPNAKDVVKVGDSFEVLWKTEPAESEFGAMVTIEFSRDGGKSWEKVQENVQNSGKYVWTVPKVEHKKYATTNKTFKLRVISQSKPIYRDTSDLFLVSTEIKK
jgi:hypothetical protein